MKPRIAPTFYLGLALILAAEILLYCDVQSTHRGPLETQPAVLSLPDPETPLATLARWTAIFMTPVAWLGYILFLDGLLAPTITGSPLRRRPNAFAFCALSSIVIWCVFDTINFYCFSPPAWTYIGPPLLWPPRFLGYVIAFAAELPAMFMTAQIVFNKFRLDRLRGPSWKLPPIAGPIICLFGIALLAWAVLGRRAVANYGLWLSFILLLDPINLRYGQPSILADWQAGRYGRTLALGAGGLCCGFLWEFWNYWALSKWIYHLPFLGQWEQIRYFQMPITGLLGFIPFGVECWVMWQTAAIPLRGLAEPLPNDETTI
jgi:hypothetical protein